MRRKDHQLEVPVALRGQMLERIVPECEYRNGNVETATLSPAMATPSSVFLRSGDLKTLPGRLQEPARAGLFHSRPRQRD